MVEGTLVKAQPITGCWGFERGKKEYGDVVERMLMRSQPIQGVRDSLKGKGGLFIFLSVCCLSVVCLSVV